MAPSPDKILSVIHDNLTETNHKSHINIIIKYIWEWNRLLKLILRKFQAYAFRLLLTFSHILQFLLLYFILWVTILKQIVIEFGHAVLQAVYLKYINVECFFILRSLFPSFIFVLNISWLLHPNNWSCDYLSKLWSDFEIHIDTKHP